jgi:hypothetical protein
MSRAPAIMSAIRASLLLGALNAGGCTIPEAHGAAPRRRHDAGLSDAGAADGQPSQAAASDSLVGLTRKQLLARRGAPTKKEDGRWIYTPEQPGCRDVVVSEVISFEGERVAHVTLQHRHTGRACGVMPGFR